MKWRILIVSLVVVIIFGWYVWSSERTKTRLAQEIVFLEQHTELFNEHFPEFLWELFSEPILTTISQQYSLNENYGFKVDANKHIKLTRNWDHNSGFIVQFYIVAHDTKRDLGYDIVTFRLKNNNKIHLIEYKKNGW
ncbi:hypothetical protein DS745_03485 [Anaerobacillus alkaliphilus]|uniref:DUF3888 domain-containing protein n=1 Tax=Anaerobacillus alkaliphilus TaxID=1548597 RepID=A0A4Q0VY23_9BACI|nr:DUF3888 domain-containing protein [Anaerobacillus alkaliphilus]RXJ04459.1 hypothetical protein DS745_03485 [Anaerobacillus alkaliphilus]